MRWSIIRLIWLRELRDQLRDRRTVFMIAVLPILLYPVAGFGVMQLALGFLAQKSVVGLVGGDQLVPWSVAPTTLTAAEATAWLALPQAVPGAPLGGVATVAGSAALAQGQVDPRQVALAASWLAWTPGRFDRLTAALGFQLAAPAREYPALVENRDDRLVFRATYLDGSPLSGPLLIRRIEGRIDPDADGETAAAEYRTWLDDRRVDVLLLVPEGLQQALREGRQPTLHMISRPRDDTSRLVHARLSGVLGRWRRELRDVRLARLGLPADFDQVVRVSDPARARAPAQQDEENLANVLVRVFPFVLVLWSLAGALYPAVDLCAGEKERGTMETLLISPASREEIVWGKFLTIWLFSGATAFLNLLSMALTTSQLGAMQTGGPRLGPLFWGGLLLLPLSAFFSALCLAVGAYARSSKEGQYYLMPLFLLTMPLIFLTLAPGVELNPFYSMVPVTGVALLLQRLVAAEGPDRSLWFYFLPVLAPMVIYSWLALRWAIGQFQREEVLFREAERLDLGLWLRRLLRDKEALPSVGEAFFCFGIILGLRWLSFGLGGHLPLLIRTGIGQLAFVATPPLIMALLLTTQPVRGLGLIRPPWWAWPAAAMLSMLLLLPLAELTLVILQQFPGLRALLELNHPLTRELQSLARGGGDSPVAYLLVLAVLPALCEELAFRGFILQGLLRGFRPGTAILLSAFLFAVHQMNVFQFAPHFLFGVILGVLVVRTGSVLPAMLFHLIYNTLLLTLPTLFSGSGPPEGAEGGMLLWLPRLVVSCGCVVLAGGGLAAIWWRTPRPRAEVAP
ncbi:MAG: ABC transporter permease subunit/CPBP intramembrane protease [Gemmataceae bacterium]